MQVDNEEIIQENYNYMLYAFKNQEKLTTKNSSIPLIVLTKTIEDKSNFYNKKPS